MDGHCGQRRLIALVKRGRKGRERREGEAIWSTLLVSPPPPPFPDGFPFLRLCYTLRAVVEALMPRTNYGGFFSFSPDLSNNTCGTGDFMLWSLLPICSRPPPASSKSISLQLIHIALKQTPRSPLTYIRGKKIYMALLLSFPPQ